MAVSDCIVSYCVSKPCFIICFRAVCVAYCGIGEVVKNFEEVGFENGGRSCFFREGV